LSCSLGVPENYEHPKFLAACDTIISQARARGLGAGAHVTYQANRIAHEERWARLGANLIIHAADIILFAEGIRRDVGDLKSRLSDCAQGRDAQINI
jgi:4-hydroxy-2-oxoheptanedioate aldolase